MAKFRVRDEETGRVFIIDDSDSPENILSTVSRRFTSPETRTATPISVPDIIQNPLIQAPRLALSASGVPEEDIAPTAFQLAGGELGRRTLIPGARTTGATAGAALGQGIRQSIRSGRGQRADLGAIGRDAFVTGIIEAVTGGTGRVAFSTARALRTQLPEKVFGVLDTAGSRINEALRKLAQLGRTNKSFSVKNEDIIKILDEEVDKHVDDFSGTQGKLLEKWKEVLLSKTEGVGADTLIRMEKTFGANADFFPGEAANVGTNNALKAVRSRISKIVDDLATKAGFPGFAKDSKAVSRAIADVRNKRHGPRISPTAAFFGATRASGQPGVGFAAAAATRALESPSTIQFLSNLLEPTGIARSSTLAGTELARRLFVTGEE